MDKRIPVALARARWLVPAAALSLLGCPDQELAPLGPCTVSAVSERVDQSGIADVDLLFMVDNSGSMATEQIKLAAQLPRLVGVLTSGDLYFGREEDVPAGLAPEKRYFTKVKTLHLGVVSSNMGGIDNFPSGSLPAVVSCQNEGDEGRLQNSTDLATEEIRETRGGRNPEFPSYVLDEVVLPADPECELPNQPKYQDYVVDGSLSPDQLATNFRCVARLGVRGCPFEQQLESVWRALAAGDGKGDQYKFLNGTKGQGDGYNTGFLRDEAILAVMLVTDEDDCSIKDAGKVMFALDDETKAEFGAINLRCGLNETNTKYLWPTDRYVEGLKSLKLDYPDRIIFGAITGIPLDTGDRTIEEILDMPDMQFREKEPMGTSGLPEPSCTATDSSNPDNIKTSEAYPPRRILQVADKFGDQAVIYSICNDDFSPALNTLIEKIASKLKGNCLPRKLTPTDGKVNCEVFELLPKNDDSKCSSARGHIGQVVERRLRENGKVVTRRACQMDQVPVQGSGDSKKAEEGKRGWYYDDFSANLKMDCMNDPQRISFQFADNSTELPSGAGAVFECFQPVARVESSDVKGFDAVNTTCVAPQEEVCGTRSNDDYQLICIGGKTCQIKCDDNTNCPPGWVCDRGNGGKDTDGPKYCQLPTCPQDEAAGNAPTASDEM